MGSSGAVEGIGGSGDGPDDVGAATGSDERRCGTGRFDLGALRGTGARGGFGMTLASRSAKSTTGSSVVPLATSSATISDQFTEAARSGA